MAAEIDQLKPPIPQADAPVDALPSSPIQALPKLSASEFRAFNRMADHMELFHNNFRRSWTIMYTACTDNARPAKMSIRQFLGIGLDFCHHLETHHSIEETYVFPDLARKMPEFRDKQHLLQQHRQIHAGLEHFEEYLEGCRRGEKELRLVEMKGLMDGFGEVLWKHLDDEVKQLGAENMRRYWTRQEMDRMVM